MSRKENQIKLKHIIALPIVYIIVFFTLFFSLQGTSGGDILLGAITAILLACATLIIGLATYSWKFKEKIGFLIGIGITFLLAFAFHSFLL